MPGVFRNHWEKWLLGFLMVSTFGWRFYQLPEYPFHTDETITITAMQSIVKTGLPLLDTGHIYWRSLVGHYLLALPLFFTDVSVYSARLVCVIFSVLVLPLAYLMGKAVESRWTGWLAAIFLAFSTFQNYNAAFARFYLPFQFFFLCAVFFGGKYFISRRPRSGFWLLLSTLAAVGTHRLSLELFPILLLAFLLGKRWELLRSRRFGAGCGIVGIAVYANIFFLPANAFVNYLAIPLQAGAMENKWFFYWAFKEFAPLAATLILLALVPAWKKERPVWRFYLMAFVGSMVAVSVISPDQLLRYMCNLFPLGVVVASASLVWWSRALIETLNTKTHVSFSPRWFAASLIVVLAATHFFALENKNFKSAFGSVLNRTPDQKPPHDFIAQRIGPADIVISMDPGLTRIYLNRPADYFIREKFDAASRQFLPFSGLEKSSMAVPVLDRPEKLEQLVGDSEKRIWFYANYKASFTLSPYMQRVVRKYFVPVYRDRVGTVFVLSARP